MYYQWQNAEQRAEQAEEELRAEQGRSAWWRHHCDTARQEAAKLREALWVLDGHARLYMTLSDNVDRQVKAALHSSDSPASEPEYEHLGDYSAVEPWHRVLMSCDRCKVTWDGCWDNYQCPRCGEGELPWQPYPAPADRPDYSRVSDVFSGEPKPHHAKGAPTVRESEHGGYVWTYCDECGPDVSVDEDGLCGMCGRDAVYFGERPAPADRTTANRTFLDPNFNSPAPASEQHPDDAAVDRFAAAMKAKLAEKRDEGRDGWDDPDRCSIEYLADLLLEHIPKGDPVDIGNFAMMLHQRGVTRTDLLSDPAPADRPECSCNPGWPENCPVHGDGELEDVVESDRPQTDAQREALRCLDELVRLPEPENSTHYDWLGNYLSQSGQAVPESIRKIRDKCRNVEANDRHGEQWRRAHSCIADELDYTLATHPANGDAPAVPDDVGRLLDSIRAMRLSDPQDDVAEAYNDGLSVAEEKVRSLATHPADGDSPAVCTWHKPDPEEEFYETSCGSAWDTIEGLRLEEIPAMRFCSTCGRRIHIAAAPDPTGGEE